MGDAGDVGSWMPGFMQTTFGYIEDVWVKGPALLSDYASLARETWKAYTESQSKRFDNLPADQQQKLMNAGLDGAVVFLLVSLVAREVLSRVVEPFIATHTVPPGKGGKPPILTFQQAKWIFTTIILFAIWHSNSHMFFDFGAPVDLGVLLVTVAAGVGTVYQITHSLPAAALFLLVPLLALAPVSVTVAAMQQGPFFTDPSLFPAYLAGITAVTALYFIYDAPETPVIHPGKTQPISFWTALKEELADFKNFHHAAAIAPAGGLRRGSVPHGKTVVKHGDVPHSGNPVVRGVTGVKDFFVGSVYKVAGFVYMIFHSIMHGVVVMLSKVPVVGKYVHAEPAVKGRAGTRPPTASRSGAAAPKLSNRVSKRREEE